MTRTALRPRPGAARRALARAALPFALAVTAATTTTDAAAAQQSAADTAAVPVVLTVSGGISLGSYQSGVNYALVEFLRRSADPAFRQRLNVERPYRLAAATGASAGNINAFLSALEWCRGGGPVAPEQSLFWRTWIPTGWEQLFPRSPTVRTDEALFVRDYFANHHRLVGGRMAEPTARAECDRPIPVGVTITRLRPDSIALDRAQSIWAATQRFVGVVEVRRDRGGTLSFRQPRTGIWTDRSLGKRLVLPSVGAGDTVEMKSVFGTIEASSAFPVAFAPVQLDYYDAADLDSTTRACPPGRRSCALRSAYFIDGGVFDNNPLDLALGIFRHIAQPPAGTPTRVVYINPEMLRGELRTNRAAAADSGTGADRGVGAIFSLVAGAFPAAREYELQSLARNLARDQRDAEAGWIRVSDRSYPIVGEHLGSFAAFLGRPFREYDFYVGLYDGLYFAALDLVCNRSSQKCAVEALKAMIEGGGFDLGPVAPEVLRALYAVEHRDEQWSAPVPAPADPLDAARADLMASLVAANRPLLDRPAPSCPPRLPLTQALFCTGGLGAVLDRFSSPQVKEIVSGEVERRRCGPDAAPDEARDCFADSTLVELLNDRPRFASATAKRLLHQLWRTEAGLRSERQRDYAGLVAGAELAYFSTAARFPVGRGMDWDPSSIQDVHSHPARTVMGWLPYQVSLNLNTGGGEIGYRPTYNLNSHLAFTFPVQPLGFRPAAGHESREWTLSAGAGVLKRFDGNGLTGFEVQLLQLLDWRGLVGAGTYSPASVYGAPAIGFTGYFLADKVRLHVRHVPQPSDHFQWGQPIAVSIGVNDFNGLLYWLARPGR